MQIEEFTSKFESSLLNEIHSLDHNVQNLVNFVLNNKGKRIRPLLVYSCCDITNNEIADSAIKASIIVELIHIATLVHDDVIDNADTRRNRKTLHRIAKTNEAILVGDILFSHALEMAASFPNNMVCREVASATKLTCMGEVTQSFAQRNYNTTLKEYEEILIGKTGKLFACACRLGALLSSQNTETIDKVTSFAENLGLIYQLYDDTLDVFGSEQNSHKTLQTDLQTQKVTLPVIKLLESCRANRAEIINKLKNYSMYEQDITLLFDMHYIKQQCLNEISYKLQEIDNQLDNMNSKNLHNKMKILTENVCNKIKTNIF